MLLMLLKLMGLKNQGLLIISPMEFVLSDMNSDRNETKSRVSVHPRSIVGDFFKVETELKSLMKSVFSKHWLYTEVLICLEGLNEGDYTTIELRAVRELIYGAGGTSIDISERTLSITEARDFFNGNNNKYIMKDA